MIFIIIARDFHKLINLTVNTTSWSRGLAGGAVGWSSGLASGAVGWTTLSDARVDGREEDVATSTLATELGGTVIDGDVGEGSVEWSGRGTDLGR